MTTRHQYKTDKGTLTIDVPDREEAESSVAMRCYYDGEITREMAQELVHEYGKHVMGAFTADDHPDPAG
jgi:hypothetical protein